MPVLGNTAPPRCGARGPRDSVAPRWSEIGQPDAGELAHENNNEIHQFSRSSRSPRSRSETPPASQPMTPSGEFPLSLPIQDARRPTSSFASEVEALNAQRVSIKIQADRLEFHEKQLRRLAHAQSDVELKELRVRSDNLRAENLVLKTQLQNIKAVVAKHERLQSAVTGKSEIDHASDTEEESEFLGRLEKLLREKQQLGWQCERVQAENDSLTKTVGQLLPKCVVLEVELQLLLRKHSGYRRDNRGTTQGSKGTTLAPVTHTASPTGGGCQQQLQPQQQLQQQHPQPQLQQLQQQSPNSVRKLRFAESFADVQEYEKPFAHWMPAVDTAGESPDGAAGRIYRSYADSVIGNYNKLVDMVEEYKKDSTQHPEIESF